MKKLTPKFALRRETIAHLTSGLIKQVAGGNYTQYCGVTTATAACTHGGQSEAAYGCTQQT